MAKFNLTVTGDTPAECVAAFLASLTDDEVLTNLQERMGKFNKVVNVVPFDGHAFLAAMKEIHDERRVLKAEAAKAEKTEKAKVKAAKTKAAKAARASGWRKPSGSKVAALAA